MRNSVMLDLLYVCHAHPMAAQIISYCEVAISLPPYRRVCCSIDTNARLVDLCKNCSLS